MIKSFNCRETEMIFRGERSKKFPTDIQKRVFRKLAMLDASETIDDLRIPPSNVGHIVWQPQRTVVYSYQP